MSSSPLIRIFFAIDLSEAVKQQIGEYIAKLKKHAKTNSIRWTKPENLHITLQFLAEMNREHLPMLIDNVKDKLLRSFKKTTVECKNIHLFPNPYRPRVIVLNLSPQEEIAKLAELIGEGITFTHYEIEKRAYHGHITLGRIKHARINLNFLTDIKPLTCDPILLDEVVLFRSDPQPEGSVYTPLEHISLTNDIYPTKNRVVNNE